MHFILVTAAFHVADAGRFMAHTLVHLLWPLG